MALSVLPGARLSERLFLCAPTVCVVGCRLGLRAWASPEVMDSLCILPSAPSGSTRLDVGVGVASLPLHSEPQIRRDHPLNLSISISGGKETNKDSLSNGERSGKSSSLKSLAVTARELWPGEAAVPGLTLSKLTWKGTSERVRAPCATLSG